MKYIDANCLIGCWPFRKIRKNTFEDLKKLHRDCNLGYGCVSSLNSIFYNDPFEGEEELHDIIKDTPYRHILTVNPTLPGYMNDVKNGLKYFDIKGVRVYPGYHGYRLNDGNLRNLCGLLEKLNLPLFLSLRMEDERLDYLIRPGILQPDEIGGFLSENGNLKILLLTFRNEELLQLKGIITSCSNIFYDTSGLKNDLFAIEKTISDFGSNKLLYGSLHPLFCLESTLLSVVKAELDDDIKEKILYKNIYSLTGR